MDGDGPITKGTLELNTHQVIEYNLQPLLSNRRSERIAHQSLTAPSIFSVGGGSRVQREAHFGHRERARELDTWLTA